MNARIKLLLGFSTLALSALIFFGLIAYDTAIETSTEKETTLLRQVFSNDIKNIFSVVQQSDEVNALLDEIASSQNDQLAIVIKDQQGNIHYQSKNINIYRDIETNIGAQKHGQFSNELHAYTWTTQEIPDTDYSAMLVFELMQAPQLSFLRQMGFSLAFTSFIVLWIAAWAAMYIASLIEKLNEQAISLQHQALHDNLTNLPNRCLLHDRLSQMLNESKREKRQFSLCFIDLNRFKEVNDTLGHHCGDELLKVVAERLLECVRESDTVARLGGDEFALLLRNADERGAELVARKIVDALEVPIMLKDNKTYVSCSIGMVTYPMHDENEEQLLRKADAAMYCAKKNGIRFLFYRPEMGECMPAKIGFSSDLKDAIANDELMVFYQAKFDLEKKQVTGAETLLRWNHPEKGFIPPPDIIEVAERTGLIMPLSYLVIEKAFRDQQEMERNGHALTIAINLSNCNLQDPSFVQETMKLVQQYKVNPKRFILELTESAVMNNPDQVKEALTALSEVGFTISIDDFGTGYSSLVNLRRLPVDEIKIDKSFVFNLASNEEDAAIVRTTIALGNSLGINVVAEGVENQEMMDFVSNFGCNVAQGFFISKPLPLNEFLGWLNAINQQLLPQTGTR